MQLGREVIKKVSNRYGYILYSSQNNIYQPDTFLLFNIINA